MLNSTMKYGALRAKVMAMTARLLTADDWARLCQCGTLLDMTGYLRSQSGWSGIFTEIPAASAAAVYSSAVRKRVLDEYEKLYRFSSLADKRMLLITLRRFEYEYLLSELRRISSGEFSIYTPEPAPFLKAHSTIDLDAVRRSDSYPSFLAAVQGSIFYDSLAALPIDESTGLPLYSSAAIVCANDYYRAAFAFMKHKASPGSRKYLIELIGSEADAVNIVSVLRLLRSFRSSLDNAHALLIPIHYRLTGDILDQLITQTGETEAVEYLRTTPCARYVEDYDVSKLDSMAEKAMAAMCRRLIHASEPDIYIPLAYLILLDQEAKKLTRLIEASLYGLDAANLI